MKKKYKFDPNDHCSIVDAMVDYAEDFCQMTENKRWRNKDQLKQYEDLKRCFEQFQQFEDAYINDWNGSSFPFIFSEINSNVRHMMQEALVEGKFSLIHAIEVLAYHMHWYSDRMNQNRLYCIHTYWLLVLDLANDFSK